MLIVPPKLLISLVPAAVLPPQIVVGRETHRVGTKYSVVAAIGNLPLFYVLVLDGIGAKLYGSRGLFLTDAAGGLVVFAIVTLLLERRRPASLAAAYAS